MATKIKNKRNKIRDIPEEPTTTAGQPTQGTNMSRTTKLIQEVIETTYEYINITNLTDTPEKMYFTMSDGTTRKVLPGNSIYFTQKDIDNAIANGDKRFMERRIIPKNSTEGVADNIIASDDLSEMEIEILVKETEKTTSFRGKVSKINAVPTLKLFLKYIEKYDKPMSFLKLVENRIDKLEEERRRMISPIAPIKDKRLVEVERSKL